jgi:hypothetical protein
MSFMENALATESHCRIVITLKYMLWNSLPCNCCIHVIGWTGWWLTHIWCGNRFHWSIWFTKYLSVMKDWSFKKGTLPNCHYTEIYAMKFLTFAGDQEYMSSYSRHDFLIITFCGEREDKQPCTYYYIPF